MAITFEELEGSPTISVTGGAVTAQRTFKVPWSQRLEMVEILWGSYRMIGGIFSFRPPAHFPDLPNVIATEIRVEPFNPGAPLGSELSSLTNSRALRPKWRVARCHANERSAVARLLAVREPEVAQRRLDALWSWLG